MFWHFPIRPADLTVGVTEPRWTQSSAGTTGLNGHHAVSVTEGHDNLITRQAGLGLLVPAGLVPAAALATVRAQQLAPLGCKWSQLGLFVNSSPTEPELCRFNISAPYHHDITLASGALQNVVSNGTGTDLVIDLHR